jgi:regulator of CtrA degradation
MTDHTAPESIGQGATVRDFASSEMFERTFAEGMQLSEETAAYLDGVGRKSRSCSRATPPWFTPGKACA